MPSVATAETTAAIGARLRRPAVALALIALVLVALVLVTPRAREEPDVALSAFSASPGGARGLFETATRLGWRTARRTTPLRDGLDPGAVYVSLAPRVPLTTAETHALLETVRAGAGLLVVVEPMTPLADSLRLGVSRWSPVPLDVVGDDEKYDDENDEERNAEAGAETSEPAPSGDSARQPPRTLRDTVLAVAAAVAAGESDAGYLRYASRYADEIHRYLKPLAPWPDDTVLFLAAERMLDSLRGRSLPVAIGFPLGAGRVVAVAAPRLFMNDVVREDAGVLPVRLLEWLAAPGERPLVFDEFHHGFGAHPNLGRAVRRLLYETPPGRVLLQLLAAGALLVLALGARPLAPALPERIERRSPLEHVGALARAYDAVGATRLTARRLVQGLRRRRTPLARGDDDAWLREIGERHPELAADVALLLDGIRRPLTPERFARLGPAIERIERTLAP